MKTCVSIPGGAIRSITCVPEIIEHISYELGYSPFDATDQSIGTSAGSITIAQNALDVTKDMRAIMPLKDFFTRIDTQNKTNVGKIFPPKNKLQMLGINPALKNGKLSLFNAPCDNTILPQIIDDTFNSATMSDFSMRTAFTVYMPDEHGQYGVRLISSYNTPDFPVSDGVGASCSFPIAFGTYDIKSEWLGEESGKIIKAIDGGLGCPNPAIRGLEEVSKIAEPNEKISIFSMMMVDTKDINYNRLYAGGMLRWLNPFNGSALTQVAFNKLYTDPHRQLTERSQSKREADTLDYYPIHIRITDEDRKKYKVSFDSIDSSPDNINAFQDLTSKKVRTDEFRAMVEPAIRAFDDRMTEKRNNEYQYKDNVIYVSVANGNMVKTTEQAQKIPTYTQPIQPGG